MQCARAERANDGQVVCRLGGVGSGRSFYLAINCLELPFSQWVPSRSSCPSRASVIPTYVIDPPPCQPGFVLATQGIE